MQKGNLFLVCSVLMCIVHSALFELMRVLHPPPPPAPTTNLISFCPHHLILFLLLVLWFTFGFWRLIICANIELSFILFLEENLGYNKDIKIFKI